MTPVGEAIMAEVADWSSITDPDSAEFVTGALQGLRFLADRLQDAGLLPEDERQRISKEAQP